MSITVASEYTVAAEDSPLQGMMGIEDFKANQRPEHFRSGLLRYQPNGTAPLFALTAMMPSLNVSDAKYHWATKSLPTQQANIAGIYTDAALSSLYTGSGSAGDYLYIKIDTGDDSETPQQETKKFRAGHQVLLAVSTDSSASVNAKIVGSPILNGASSYLPVKLLEDDDNSIASNDLTDADLVIVTGNINPDGSLRPESIIYTEQEYYNYCQTFRTSLNLTRRRRLTRARWGDPYQEAKADAAQDHSMEIEKALLWGELSYTTGSNGQPETTTRGIISQIRNSVPDHYKVFNLDDDSRYAGKEWTEVGYEWLLYSMEQCFRYTGGGPSRLVYSGTWALAAIQELAKSISDINVTMGSIDTLGIKVAKITTVFGDWFLQVHPLFSHLSFARRGMLVLAPQNLVYNYLTDTAFRSQPDRDNGEGGKDGTEEDFLTDCGLELHFPHTFMYLDGIGLSNTAVAS